MSDHYEFTLSSGWSENSDGDGIVKFAWGGSLAYGIPEGSGGKPGRSNPEEMLIASVVSCFSITLALLYERKRLTVPRIETGAEGTMIRLPDKSLRFTAIVLHPRIFPGDTETDKDSILLDMARKAEKYCVISNALRGNVEITVVPQIVR